jgi:hypothetical protein
MDLCLHCSCPATVEIVTGEWLCEHHFDQVPRNEADPCPNCSEPASATPVGVEGGSDAPVPAHSPVGTGAVIRPSLEDMEAGLKWCANATMNSGLLSRREYEVMQHTADVLRLAVTVAKAYRTQGHAQADDPDYWQLWVPKVVAELGDELIRKVARS